MVLTCLLFSLTPQSLDLLITSLLRVRRQARIILTTSLPSVVIQTFPLLFSSSVKQILLPITTPYIFPLYLTILVTLYALTLSILQLYIYILVYLYNANLINPTVRHQDTPGPFGLVCQAIAVYQPTLPLLWLDSGSSLVLQGNIPLPLLSRCISYL